jgi:hypothetical protein
MEAPVAFCTSKVKALEAISRMFPKDEWNLEEVMKAKPFDKSFELLFITHLESKVSVMLVIDSHLANNGAMLYVHTKNLVDTYA